MDEKPKRRWFRFRLSTVLILTAIAAGGMATRPYLLTSERFIRQADTAMPGPSWFPVAGSMGVTLWTVEVRSLNPRLLWPALALFAFLAWKAACAVVASRRGKSATAE
jgi:hypothetical protein